MTMLSTNPCLILEGSLNLAPNTIQKQNVNRLMAHRQHYFVQELPVMRALTVVETAGKCALQTSMWHADCDAFEEKPQGE